MTPTLEGPDFDQPSDEPASSLLETVSAAEPAGVARQTRRHREQLRNSAEFWQDVFSTPEGRREAWKILEDHHTFENPGGISANGSYDPAVTAFFHGQKALGLRQFRLWLGYSPDGVMLMLSEHPLPEVAEAMKVKPRPRAAKTPTKTP